MLPQVIHQHLSTRFKLHQVIPVSGGNINNTALLVTSLGRFFLKWNNNRALPGMFAAEAQGLQLIAATGAIATPQIVELYESEVAGFILMEFIEAGGSNKNALLRLGMQLAALHRHTGSNYGLASNNYIGSLPQHNRPCTGWCDFFISQRLQPMVTLALQKGLLTGNDAAGFDKLYGRLNGLLPAEPPSLLHGDLWSGNYLIDTAGKPWLIDPAAYYGNREMDIAMTLLFGGFGAEFYEGYSQVYPLQPGWQQRMEICNLYPLLVHINLFGHSYLPPVRACLAKYC